MATRQGLRAVGWKVGFDIGGVVKRSRGVAAQLNNGVGFLMKKNKVDVIWGEATLAGGGKVTPSRSRPCSRSRPKGALGRRHLHCQARHRRDRRAPARAARARAGRQAGLDLFRGDGAADACRSRSWSMGSGAIGIEFASFYRTLGAEVTVVEVLPQILPVEDAEIAAHARKRFEKQGMKILTEAKVTKA
jgi:dihydrolipoamide dehydrogenase